jgi:hypothetical protein
LSRAWRWCPRWQPINVHPLKDNLIYQILYGRIEFIRYLRKEVVDSQPE